MANLHENRPVFFQQGGFMSFQLVGQSLSTLVSTSFQHVSACRRCHSFTEAVYLALLSFLGLISSFHNVSPVFGFFYSLCSRRTKNLVFPATLHIIPKSTFLVKRFFLVFTDSSGFFNLFLLSYPFLRASSDTRCRFLPRPLPCTAT